jgi:hypothetical protein
MAQDSELVVGHKSEVKRYSCSRSDKVSLKPCPKNADTAMTKPADKVWSKVKSLSFLLVLQAIACLVQCGQSIL